LHVLDPLFLLDEAEQPVLCHFVLELLPHLSARVPVAIA
jgi:hypothetical protein